MENDVLYMRKEYEWMRGMAEDVFKRSELRIRGTYSVRLWEVAQLATFAGVFCR
ncbi:MAG: hypothetical protein QW677_08830 [Pyrobaculum sp.]|uniref:hypothetical protein n=1 Tax=Pyrobaculum sp. TaxID=2004705 RepID=UPI00316325DB